MILLMLMVLVIFHVCLSLAILIQARPTVFVKASFHLVLDFSRGLRSRAVLLALQMKCHDCGNSSFTEIDALTFCAVCGAQINVTATQEEEDLDVTVMSRVRKRKQPDPEHVARVKREQPNSFRRRTALVAAEMQEITERCSPEPESSPSKTFACLQITDVNEHIGNDALESLAKKATCMTMLISHVADVLVQDFDFPASFKAQCRAVWQRYLSECRVAYCEEEWTDDVERCYSVTVKAPKPVVPKLSKATKKANKQLQQIRTLFSASEEAAVEESPQPVLFVEKKFKVDAHAARRLKKIETNMPFLASLLYLAALNVGINGVFMSDLLRWMREDRIPLPFEVTVSALSIKVLKECSLSEHSRYFALFCQNLKLPIADIALPLEELTIRLLHHVNLPRSMVARLRYLLNRLQLENTLNVKNSEKQHGFVRKSFDFYNLAKPLNRTHYWRYAFRKYLAPKFGDDIHLALETKLCAVILLALKLCFDVNSVDESDNAIGGFSFRKWRRQFFMRVCVLRGRSAKEVLEFGRNLEVSDTSEHVFGMSRSIKSGRLYSRKRRFEHCVPTHYTFHKSGQIPNFLVEDQQRLLTGNYAVHAPLKALTLKAREELQNMASDELILQDQEAVNVFFEDFENTFRIEFGQSEEQNVLNLFPNCNNYKIAPRPIFTSFSLDIQAEPNTAMLSASLNDANLLYQIHKLHCAPLCDLIDAFALLIGEEPTVLCFALVLMEIRFFERKKMEKLVARLTSGPTDLKAYKLCSDELQDEDILASFLKPELGIASPLRFERSISDMIEAEPSSESSSSSSDECDAEANEPPAQSHAQKKKQEKRCCPTFALQFNTVGRLLAAKML